MTDHNALSKGDTPRTSSQFPSIVDAQRAIKDTVERLFDAYRDKDLPPLADVTLGDPVKLVKFPTLAIIPESGERTDQGCSVFDGLDLYVLRLYAEFIEGTQGKLADEHVGMYLQALIDMFMEHQGLETAAGRARVYEAWPARWIIGAFIQEDRATGKRSRIRGGALELAITVTGRIGPAKCC